MQNNRERKIVIITGDTSTLLKSRYDFIRELKARKIEVHVLGPNDRTRKLAEKKLASLDVLFSEIPIFYPKTNLRKNLRAYRAIKRILRRLKPEAVYSYGFKPVVIGSIAAKATKVRNSTSMMTGLGHLYTFEDWRTRIGRCFSDLFLKYVFKLNKVVFFQNQDDANLMLETGLINKKKVVVVNGSGVNLVTFSRKSLPKQTALTFLFVGQLVKAKGFFEYCEAVNIIRKHYPGMHYQALGSCRYNFSGETQAQAEKLMRESGIEYLGESDNVVPFLHKAHVIVFPSYREGTPKALLEALAVGRPIITTDAPGCKETVVVGKKGIKIHTRDPWAISEAMKFFVNNPENLEPMAKFSRELAERKFDVAKINDVLIKHIFNIEMNEYTIYAK